MKRYITSIILCNVQSWDNNQREIRLEPTILNVIIGDNEAGKSVIFKLLYEMYFPGTYGIAELLRDGTATGALLITLQDETQIMFAFTLTTREFYLSVPGMEPQVWRQQDVPKEVTQTLGFVINSEYNVLLNVIDKDVPLLFVKSSPKLNASLLRSVFEPPEVTEFLKNCKDKLIEVQMAKDVVGAATSVAEARYSALEYIDVESITRKREQALPLVNALSELERLTDCICDLHALTETKPLEVSADFMTARGHIQTLTSIQKIDSVIQTMQMLVRPSPVENPSSVKPIIQLYNKLNKTSETISALAAEISSPPKSVEIDTSIPGLLKVIDTLTAVRTLVKETITATRNKLQVDEALANSVAEISRLQKEIGVCPTCGRAFDE